MRLSLFTPGADVHVESLEESESGAKTRAKRSVARECHGGRVYYRTPMRLRYAVIDGRLLARGRRDGLEFECDWSALPGRRRVTARAIAKRQCRGTGIIHYCGPSLVGACSKAVPQAGSRVITARLGRTGNNCISRRTAQY